MYSQNTNDCYAKVTITININYIGQNSNNLQVKEPQDVMYGWCHKCREKYAEEYKNLVG